MSFPTKYDLIDSYSSEFGLWTAKDGEIARTINANAEAKQDLKSSEWGRVKASEVAVVKRSKVLDAMLRGCLSEGELEQELEDLSSSDIGKHYKAAKKTIHNLLSQVQDDSQLYGGYWSRIDELNRLARIGSQLFGVDGKQTVDGSPVVV